MQYLPYTQEQTWGQTYGYKPSAYINMDRWPVEDLPMSYKLGNSFFTNLDKGNYWRAAADIVFVPFTELADAAWWFWNASLNWYKRLYNNAAALYNNVAAGYNNWRATRSTPQTRLTWRKITYDMNPAYYNQTIDFAEKPKQYLVGTDWNIVAQIENPYPYVSRVVQAQQLTPGYGNQGALTSDHYLQAY